LSWVDWISLILGTIQALATLVAIYFAWRAVEEAHQTRIEAGKERRLAYLERMAVTVAEIRRTYDYDNRVERHRQIERLKALLQTTPEHLPKTRSYANYEIGSTFPDQRYRDLGQAAHRSSRTRPTRRLGPRSGHETA
jgi:hypothetical protein